MTKYSTEFKMKLVKEYLEENSSYQILARKYNIPNKIIIINWVNAFKTQGYEGLRVSRKNNNYSFFVFYFFVFLFFLLNPSLSQKSIILS